MERAAQDRPSRPFGLGDSLILMAALALTLVGLRSQLWFTRCVYFVPRCWDESLMLLGYVPWNQPGATRGQVAASLAITVIGVLFVELLSWLLFGLTLAQPLLRIRRPRPPLREVIRQSGLAACLGVILGTMIVMDIHWFAGVDVLARLPVLPLALLWPVLGVFPWRSEASWIDRLGRAVGWGWLIVGAGVAAIVLLAPYAER